MTTKKIVVDTDILVGHLIHNGWMHGKGDPSVLRKALSLFFCYTTVFNVVEVFSLCRTKREIEAAESSMHALKILGLNGKSGKNLGLMRQHGGSTRDLDLLIAGICLESKLPLLTGRPNRYGGIRGLRSVTPNDLQQGNTAEEILRAGGHKIVSA